MKRSYNIIYKCMKHKVVKIFVNTSTFAASYITIFVKTSLFAATAFSKRTPSTSSSTRDWSN